MATIKQKSNDEWRNQKSREQIESGGLPLNAEWRLRRLTEGQHLFTSGQSVNELALTLSIGMRPLGQVMGCSSYHVGWQPQPIISSMELHILTNAHDLARRLALSRLQQEAKSLGARAVLGIRFDCKSDISEQHLLEVIASGTAVGWQDPSTPPDDPLLCALSGQELRALRQGGYMPVGVALGTCVYYQIGSPMTTWATQNAMTSSTARMNQELTDYTAGFTTARQTAAERQKENASWFSAEGLLGTRIEKKIETREVELEIYEQKIQRRDLIIHIVMLGTAVASISEHVPPIFPVMPLSG